MSDFVLSACSTADLSKEHFEKRDIKYICFHFEIDGTEYQDDLGKSISLDKFYQMMADGAMTRTSQVSVGEYEEYFDSFLSQGKDLLHLTLSSGISGTYNSAMIAKSAMEEKYPDRKIYVVDSLAASAGFGLLMDKLADLRDIGMGTEGSGGGNVVVPAALRSYCGAGLSRRQAISGVCPGCQCRRLSHQIYRSCQKCSKVNPCI